MSYIYKITNDINDKIYIGKTAFSIQKRFQEHCSDAFRERCEKRPLYTAMRKYGVEHFFVEEIEQCDDSLAADREAYWIGVYEAYSKGYNATLGGDGKFLYDHEAIKQRLLEFPYAKLVAQEFGCCTDTVCNIAHAENIQLKQSYNSEKKKIIQCYSKQNEFIKEFESTAKAAEWCFATGKCKTLNSGVRAHIAEVANGKRKSAYTYIWRYN